MRKLITRDVFAAARIVKASGVRDDLKKMVMQLTTQTDYDAQSIGIDGILLIMEAMAENGAEKAIYAFLAGPFEMDPLQVEELELAPLAQLLTQLGKENDLESFFGYLSGLLGKS